MGDTAGIASPRPGHRLRGCSGAQAKSKAPTPISSSGRWSTRLTGPSVPKKKRPAKKAEEAKDPAAVALRRKGRLFGRSCSGREAHEATVKRKRAESGPRPEAKKSRSCAPTRWRGFDACLATARAMRQPTTRQATLCRKSFSQRSLRTYKRMSAARFADRRPIDRLDWDGGRWAI